MTRTFFRWLTPLLLLIVICMPAHAQQWRTEPSSPLDQQYRQSQIDRIAELARLKMGTPLNGKLKNDLQVLQRLLDQRWVRSQQVEQLQAMGIVLGELLRKQYGLQWVTYIDKLGRSRALQIPGTNEFIFPVTQISRRAEVGIEVDVSAVYQELVDAVENIRNRPHSFR